MKKQDTTTKEKFFSLTNKSLKELGVENYQELWTKVQDDYKGLSCEVHAEFETKEITSKKTGEVKTKYTMVLSTEDEDRHGDIVRQEWDLAWFKKNPVLLDSHNYSSIEHIIGKLKNIKVVDKKLKADIEFNLSNPKGIMAKEMVENGFLNANSVGFIPKEFDDKGNILKSELLEDSLVSVPANPRALLEKQVEEVKKDIEDIEKDLDTKTDVKVIKSSIDNKKEILKKIRVSIENIKKEEAKKEKRELFKALRNLNL